MLREFSVSYVSYISRDIFLRVKNGKKSPRTSTIVQFIFYFWSFEISVNILRNQKYMIGLDSSSRQVSNYLDPILMFISPWLPWFNCWFSFAPVFQWCCSTPQGSPGVGRNTFLSSPHLCFIIVFICDLFVSRDDPLMS